MGRPLVFGRRPVWEAAFLGEEAAGRALASEVGGRVARFVAGVAAPLGVDVRRLA